MWGIGNETSTLAAQPPPMPTDTSTVAPVSPAAPSAAPTANPLDHPVDGIAFQMRVPAIDYSATVREGVDLPTLEYGPGHYPSTAWPGHPGIVGVAAHNIFWLRFSQLKPGDDVVIQTRRGTYSYSITASEITNPNDRTILVPSSEHRLVMTTCWPLWAGALATKRLIFFAQQTGPFARSA